MKLDCIFTSYHSRLRVGCPGGCWVVELGVGLGGVGWVVGRVVGCWVCSSMTR